MTTTPEYDEAVAELASITEALWALHDNGHATMAIVLEVQKDSDHHLKAWAVAHGMAYYTAEDLADVLVELRKRNADRFTKES